MEGKDGEGKKEKGRVGQGREGKGSHVEDTLNFIENTFRPHNSPLLYPIFDFNLYSIFYLTFILFFFFHSLIRTL